MNKQQKEQYLRDYGVLKSQGKPFFPYAVAKDARDGLRRAADHHLMSIVLGAELGPKADPTTTTYAPRPEWYFFFLFELLRVIKPPALVPLATIGVPTICMILLFLLPFYDRGPERRPERRPIATTAGILTIVAMGYLTYLGATAGPPTQVDIDPPTTSSPRAAARSQQFKKGSSGRRAVGLPGLPQDRRERQRRPRARADRDRRAAAEPGDPAHAAQPDRADAVVQEPAADRTEQFDSDGRLPVGAQVGVRSGDDRARSGRRAARSKSRRSGRCSTASPASTTS